MAYTYNNVLNLTIGDVAGVLYATQVTYDRFSNDLVYASFVGYKTAIDEVHRLVSKTNEHLVVRTSGCSCYKRKGLQYVMETNKNNNTDVIHATIFLKDFHKVQELGEEWTIYMYVKAQDENKEARLKELLLDKLNKYSSVPILPEWIDFIYTSLSDHMTQMQTVILANTEEIEVYKLSGNQASIRNLISEGLKTNAININGSNESSVMLDSSTGLNDYLSLFGSILANKIQQKFKPKFIPGVDPYSGYLCNLDDYIHHKGVELYAAQMAVIQASANNFNINKHGFIVGEMGSGKSIMTGSIFYTHNSNKNKGFNAMIMCPSHLVEKWKSEMEKYIPNTKGYIIHNLDELLEIEPKLRNRNRVENMFVIMSKEIAKLGYDLRPAAIWSHSKKCFVCPECGQPLYKEESVKQPYSSKKVKVKVKLTELDFLKQYSYNMECPNKTKVWNEEKKCYEDKECKCKLWTTLNRDEDHGWIKLGEQGWILQNHIAPITEDFMAKENINKKETELFNKLFEQYELYQEGKPYKISYKGSKKYPVAKYIYKRMNGVFDYLGLDEAHLLMNNSLQGIASHHLMKSAKHTLLLTGTLLNGFAANLFYTLFRVCPNIMRQEGFTYEDEAEFARLFGVISRESMYRIERGMRTGRTGSIKEKRLPGVSPLVFTKFLLNLTSFITLDDMAEGLPLYREIPIAVELDRNTAEGYADIETFFRRRISTFSEGSRKIMGSVIRLMTQYPDAPHVLRRIINPDSGEVEYEPYVLDKSIRNKEEKLLEIIQEKIANGEKVLVYYNTVNTTDLGDHLCSYLCAEDIQAFELKASVKAEKRMEYINKEVAKGAQVMITNPSLVETGLDLLEFTTIVFFQVGYNLSTMRQASRRSWRLSQTKDIEVYFLYYANTIQEQAISLMATKLQAAQTLEGNFSEEGLKAMSQNDDVLTQIANNVVNDIKTVVDLDAFKSARQVKKQANTERPHSKSIEQIEYVIDARGQKNILPKTIKSVNQTKNKTYINSEYIDNLIRLFM